MAKTNITKKAKCEACGKTHDYIIVNYEAGYIQKNFNCISCGYELHIMFNEDFYK